MTDLQVAYNQLSNAIIDLDLSSLNQVRVDGNLLKRIITKLGSNPLEIVVTIEKKQFANTLRFSRQFQGKIIKAEGSAEKGFPFNHDTFCKTLRFL